MFMEAYCPDSHNASLHFDQLADNVRTNLEEVFIFFDEKVTSAQNSLEQVVSVTSTLDYVVETALANDWLPKLFILFLNVINGALFFGLMTSRMNCVFYPYKSMLSYLLVPAFAFLIFLSIVATSGFGIAAVVNADFCAGGPGAGSPEGTIKQIFSQQNITETDVIHRSFQYYMTVRPPLIAERPFD